MVVGFHRGFDYDELVRASAAVRNGARFVATNLDATYPVPGGMIPGSGAIGAAVATASGRAPEVAGKPERPMVDLIRARFGSSGLVVGDRPSTDGALAEALGWPFALVLSGVTHATRRPAENRFPNRHRRSSPTTSPRSCLNWSTGRTTAEPPLTARSRGQRPHPHCGGPAGRTRWRGGPNNPRSARAMPAPATNPPTCATPPARVGVEAGQELRPEPDREQDRGGEIEGQEEQQRDDRQHRRAARRPGTRPSHLRSLRTAPMTGCVEPGSAR